MKIGSFKTANYARCAGLGMLTWLILYLFIWVIGGLIDYYHPELLLWLYGD